MLLTWELKILNFIKWKSGKNGTIWRPNTSILTWIERETEQKKNISINYRFASMACGHSVGCLNWFILLPNKLIEQYNCSTGRPSTHASKKKKIQSRPQFHRYKQTVLYCCTDNPIFYLFRSFPPAGLTNWFIDMLATDNNTIKFQFNSVFHVVFFLLKRSHCCFECCCWMFAYDMAGMYSNWNEPECVSV